jgi:hypothetical protein
MDGGHPATAANEAPEARMKKNEGRVAGADTPR